MDTLTHTCWRWQSVILSRMASWSGRYLLWRRCCQLWVSSKSPISADGGDGGRWQKGESLIFIIWSENEARNREVGRWATDQVKRRLNKDGESWGGDGSKHTYTFFNFLFIFVYLFFCRSYIKCADACISICPTPATIAPRKLTTCRCLHVGTALVVTTATESYPLACRSPAAVCQAELNP